MLRAGAKAPSFRLTDIDTSSVVSDPWHDGPVVLAFFKVTCPVCQMTAPKVAALAEGGARVVGIGQDPAGALQGYRAGYGQAVPTLTEPRPYAVATAYDLEAVPTLFLVDDDGVIADAVAGWDREGWNRVARAAGGKAVSTPGDGLAPYKPG